MNHTSSLPSRLWIALHSRPTPHFVDGGDHRLRFHADQHLHGSVQRPGVQPLGAKAAFYSVRPRPISRKMILSVSRRTDIPAFYAEWFIRRVRAGYCTVPNPFNPRQLTQISLEPENVEVIVFWTRNPRPLFPHLTELDERGYRYYFQYTLLNNPRAVDPKAPAMETAIRTFRQLADRIGPQKVIWRYDPIVLTQLTGAAFHRQSYEHIVQTLRGYTRRSVVSVMDVYPKAQRRLAEMARQGAALLSDNITAQPWFGELMRAMVEIAGANGMEIVSCAEELDLQPYGIRPGKCVDDDYIREVFGLDVSHTKDPGQRAACGCVVSKDIGMYDSCLFGCQYCYATRSFERAKANHAAHNPDSPSLLEWYETMQPLLL